MALNKKEFSQYIREFNFRELFNEMGWNKDKTSEPITVDNITFLLKSVAQKSGFKILVCEPTPDGNIPDYKVRKKIETKVTKLFQEHLIIFINRSKTQQIWLYVVRQAGKPVKATETRYYHGQNPELLFQRAAGIFFQLDEEEKITIVDVTRRIAENFNRNAEGVVKRFYTDFSKHHQSFYDFVSGIDDHIDEFNAKQTKSSNKTENKKKQWYVSLTLNRLMFCYFIQKQRFLDNNQNYLKEKLESHHEKYGKDKFYSFYKTFLMVLFHDGLGRPNHDEELIEEIGKIPYLNGGLFDVHELEDEFREIEIEDEAFKRIFDFFDEWNWHLDTRKEAKGKDINPDVIGYIFEKYINERAQMGAYYTKEDITGYISKNCILPFLFEETRRNYPKAFLASSEIGQMLKTSGDTYIYDAVKYGAHEPLPEEIEVGLDKQKPNLLERRKDWNKPAPESHALPTEIWREVVDRRERYEDIKIKIQNGEIGSINDFITYNLDITQFAEDVIFNTTDPKFLEAFYKALNRVTIIDPTCGSGAFLFAAMNILESTYESCIQRMRNFIEDEDRHNRNDTETFAHKFQYFRDVLNNIQSEKHPNQQYFIYKNIILHNLYGVDLMNEAVEIAKLRLFLKLVATVEADQRKPNLGLEPLPDIDFNIRSGNTLVGYASQHDIDNLTALLVSDDEKAKLLEDCDVVALAFKRYKEIQLSQNYDFQDFKLAKHELNTRLTSLNKSLNKTLFKEHYEGMNYGNWKDSHEPFHWFAEFYEIIHDRGGFDIVIGNPPYVEYSKVRSTYVIKSYVTLDCGNLYAFAMERGLNLLHTMGRLGFIVPISLTCTQRMASLQNLLSNNSSFVWNSTYAERPDRLFSGAEVLLTISLLTKGGKEKGQYFSTGLRKWKSEEREHLFEVTAYNMGVTRLRSYILPKISSRLEISILSKFWNENEVLGKDFRSHTPSKIFYRIGGGRYWKVFTTFQPSFTLNGIPSISSRESYLYFDDDKTRDVAVTVLSSTLFYWYFVLTTNGRDLNPSDLKLFPIVVKNLGSVQKRSLAELSQKLMQEYRNNKKEKEKFSNRTGHIIYEEFYPRLSKKQIDKIDAVLGEHLGFDEEELDFIINYDIKYRMGKGLDSDDEE
jgi:hypothetical protein